MKAMQFNEDFPALPMGNFQNHYYLVFDLTSLQDAAEQLDKPELSRKSLRFEMIFQVSLGASNGSDSLGRKTIKHSN